MLTRRALLLSSLVAPLFAGDVRMSKPASQWNANDVEWVLTRSPWAKDATVDYGGGGEPGGRPLQARVLWESALPIRLAAKKDSGAQPKNRYVISLRGMPMGNADFAGTRDPQQIVDRMRDSATLVRRGKEPFHAFSAQMPEGESGPIIFQFDAGSQPIVMEDHEVTFSVQMGPLTVTAKFLLREMLYKGHLEL